MVQMRVQTPLDVDPAGVLGAVGCVWGGAVGLLAPVDGKGGRSARGRPEHRRAEPAAGLGGHSCRPVAICTGASDEGAKAWLLRCFGRSRSISRSRFRDGDRGRVRGVAPITPPTALRLMASRTAALRAQGRRGNAVGWRLEAGLPLLQDHHRHYRHRGGGPVAVAIANRH